MPFNRRHGAKSKKFKPDGLVFARDFRTGQPNSGLPDTICDDMVVHYTTFQGFIWKRHVNQLRPHVSLGETIDLTDASGMPSIHHQVRLQRRHPHYSRLQWAQQSPSQQRR
uniref:CSD domain-containing protein n=1 Tax=Haemonchus placei TaxID=6290 RepID=A0A0N4W4F2_HAEPC